MNWLAQAGDEDQGWATFVVNIDGALLLAPRRSEHVACAGGRDVLAAGELQFDSAGAVREASNQSTGYRPPASSWTRISSRHRSMGSCSCFTRFRGTTSSSQPLSPTGSSSYAR
jgi:hypothetical protein